MAIKSQLDETDLVTKWWARDDDQSRKLWRPSLLQIIAVIAALVSLYVVFSLISYF